MIDLHSKNREITNEKKENTTFHFVCYSTDKNATEKEILFLIKP